MKKILCISVLTLLAACGGADEFAASTPDVRGQSIELTGSSLEGATFLQESSGVSSQDLSNPPEYLAKTRTAIKGLNDLVKKFVGPVVDAVALGGKDLSGKADTKVFGPKDEANLTWKLTVKRISGRRFGWILEGKPLGQFDSAYKTVAAGALQRIGNADHRGAGRTSIDLDAYASIDPTSHAQGKLFNAFKHFGDDGDAKVVVYVLKGFTADSTAAAPADGVIYGHKAASGEAVVRFAAVSESLAPLSQGTADAGPELMLARLRWIPAVGGPRTSTSRAPRVSSASTRTVTCPRASTSPRSRAGTRPSRKASRPWRSAPPASRWTRTARSRSKGSSRRLASRGSTARSGWTIAKRATFPPRAMLPASSTMPPPRR